MYSYDLGWHIKTQQLCRIPKHCIPVGTVKIIRYRAKHMGWVGRVLVDPYMKDGELDSRYWSIPRAQDIEYYLQKRMK